MYKGSCLCGDIRFQVDGPINDIIYCHCSLCRKAQGSAFAANANVAKKDFRLLNGMRGLTGYEARPGETKYFCASCGSPIMSLNSARPDTVRIRLGTIESDITERPGCHIFVGSKANWEQITDDLPQYDEYAPE
jgi:hypothetical protein